jgi:hypothetical protein
MRTFAKQLMLRLPVLCTTEEPDFVPPGATALDCGFEIIYLMFPHITECAWCGKTLSRTLQPTRAEWISHGICPECKDAELAQ